MSTNVDLRFPIVLRGGLKAEHVDRWRRYYARASDRERTREDGIWRRTQETVNADESGWRNINDKRRRIVHYSHQYDLLESDSGSELVLNSTYLYYSLSLPMHELVEAESRIRVALASDAWQITAQTAGTAAWICGDLECRLNISSVHLEDVQASRFMPSDYRTLDVTIRSLPPTAVPERLPWQVLSSGMRMKGTRGNPEIIEDLSAIANFLPFHVELGCGASLEAGVPALNHLHDLYRVTELATGKFVFGGPGDDLVEGLLLQPKRALIEFTRLFQAAFLAEPTPAHHALVAMKSNGALIGPIMTNNFDGLAHRVGLEELYLRRYDEVVPDITIHPRARSLLVIGSHADRRRVQARARDKGLKIFYLDPEGYRVGNQFIRYPLESALDGDFLCRKGACEGLSQLRSLLGLVRPPTEEKQS